MVQFILSMTISMRNRTIVENYKAIVNKESFLEYYEVNKYSRARSNLSQKPFELYWVDHARPYLITFQNHSIFLEQAHIYPKSCRLVRSMGSLTAGFL